MANDISSLFGLDPDVLRYQMLQQQMGKYNQYPNNPQQNLASTLGSILGGGAVNLTQGRNAFAIDNPLLRKASALQDIYGQTARMVDPEADPATFYKELQSNLRSAGYGREALMASQEARKYSVEERKLSAAEKQSSGVASTSLVTTNGAPVYFDKENKKYYVQGEPWNLEKHGPIRDSMDPFKKQLAGVMGGGTGTLTSPTGKGNTTKPSTLSEEEKRRLFDLQTKLDADRQQQQVQNALNPAGNAYTNPMGFAP